jgi:hypothetical protein
MEIGAALTNTLVKDPNYYKKQNNFFNNYQFSAIGYKKRTFKARKNIYQLILSFNIMKLIC